MIATEPDLKLLYPLDEFYSRAGLIVPRAQEVRGADVPEPYNQLLVHRRDMTPTLEAYHGERIRLRTIGKRVDGDALSRLVVLLTVDSERPVEFGAIVIHCQNFPAEARATILECRRPLGTILADYHVEHSSSPRAFLELSSDPLINGALDIRGPVPLFGRRNVLSRPDGLPLAEVVEILPPAGD